MFVYMHACFPPEDAVSWRLSSIITTETSLRHRQLSVIGVKVEPIQARLRVCCCWTGDPSRREIRSAPGSESGCTALETDWESKVRMKLETPF